MLQVRSASYAEGTVLYDALLVAFGNRFSTI